VAGAEAVCYCLYSLYTQLSNRRSATIHRRAYSMAKRAAFSASTRRRILDAARRLLAARGRTDLGLDAVARAAGVSRTTVYNHFGSRSGLLEALYDYLAERGNVRRGKNALLQHDLDVVIAGFIGALAGFWSSDAIAIRRLHAMAALDAEIAKGLAARENRRRRAAGQIVRRFASAAARRPYGRTDRLVADALCAVASFETYDALARAGHGLKEIIPVMIHLAREILARRVVARARRRSP
jgi:AcrR family transcriptional regulator